MADSLTRERVIDVALDLLESEGVEGLTMRALAAKLGCAVTAIYWHVGAKEDLFAALVERIGAEVGGVEVSGRTPDQRVRSVARSLRTNLLAHGDLVSVTSARGRHAVVFVPARRALAETFGAAGLRGARLAGAVNAVVHLVVGSVLVQRAVERAPEQRDDDMPLWDGDAPVDRAAATRLRQPIDQDDVFEASLQALVRGLLAG